MNSNLADIATAITQSVATTGVSSMTGAFLAASGSAVTPSISFSSDTSTGLYLAGTHQIGISTNGVVAVTINSDGSVTFVGNVNNSSGVPVGVPVGSVMDFAGSSAPSGWLLCYGQSLSTSTYASLFAVIGYTYGGAGASFNTPDYRGTTLAGKDNMGGVSAGRIGTVSTDSGTIVGTTLGSRGGSSTHTQSTGEMPFHAHTATSTDAGHTHTYGTPTLTGLSGIQSGNNYTNANATTGLGFASITTTVDANGGSVAMAWLQPTMIVNKIIYAGHS